jgi:ABC-type transport system substrate-binding protein
LQLNDDFSIIELNRMCLRRRVLGLWLLLSLLSVVLPGPGFPATRQLEEPRYGGTLRIRPFLDKVFRPNFDPAGDAHLFLLEQVYDGLVRLDKNLNVMPVLAEYWLISEDGKRFTFYLRKGVKFHHGKELDAEDVKFSLERLIRSETQSPYAHHFISNVLGAKEFWEGKAKDVVGFKVRDRYTFEIEWLHPYVSALSLLSADFSKILPRDLVLSQGRNFFLKPSGTGPFKFVYWLRSPRLEIVGARLERNDEYFGRKPYLEALEFSPYYTLDHFIDKEADIVPYISERLANADCQVLENESFSTAFLAMSCHTPPLTESVVRRAVAMAIDKKEIAKAAFRLDTAPQVTNNYIPAKLPGFFPADDSLGFNADEAKKILRQNGYFEEGSFPPFIFFCKEPRSEEDEKIFRSLRDMLSGLGIKIRLKSYRSREEVRTSTEPYFILINWRMEFPDPENVVVPLFLSNGSVNQSLIRYSNSRLDELAKKAEVERSWTQRISLFHQIEAILDEDVPAVPLFSRQRRLAVQSYVRGVRLPAPGSFDLDARDIWLDK